MVPSDPFTQVTFPEVVLVAIKLSYSLLNNLLLKEPCSPKKVNFCIDWGSFNVFIICLNVFFGIVIMNSEIYA